MTAPPSTSTKSRSRLLCTCNFPVARGFDHAVDTLLAPVSSRWVTRAAPPIHHAMPGDDCGARAPSTAKLVPEKTSLPSAAMRSSCAWASTSIPSALKLDRRRFTLLVSMKCQTSRDTSSHARLRRPWACIPFAQPASKSFAMGQRCIDRMRVDGALWRVCI